MTEYAKYVLGVATTEDSVVLVKKNRPEWQKGFYNFVGGKVEAGEKYIDAMVREFEEETSLRVPQKKWKKFGHLYKPQDFTCMLFISIVDIDSIKSNSDEEIEIVSHLTMDGTFQEKCISNVPVIWKFLNSKDFLDDGAQLHLVYPKIVSQ